MEVCSHLPLMLEVGKLCLSGELVVFKVEFEVAASNYVLFNEPG